ncbi:TRAP transporter small permease [Hydrogenophaga sp.]|uniref:TRAP transporter small permease n=1 Tax=Hydrogenophaga sp. TaxID=1904254 RepID=UPI003D283300
MRRLFSAIETVAALTLLLVAVLTAGNVLVRYAFSTQIPDWFDGSQMLQGIAMFWGIALATYYGTHIGVDIVWEHLQPAGQRRVDLVATTITAAYRLGWPG